MIYYIELALTLNETSKYSTLSTVNDANFLSLSLAVAPFNNPKLKAAFER